MGVSDFSNKNSLNGSVNDFVVHGGFSFAYCSRFGYGTIDHAASTGSGFGVTSDRSLIFTVT